MPCSSRRSLRQAHYAGSSTSTVVFEPSLAVHQSQDQPLLPLCLPPALWSAAVAASSSPLPTTVPLERHPLFTLSPIHSPTTHFHGYHGRLGKTTSNSGYYADTLTSPAYQRTLLATQRTSVCNILTSLWTHASRLVAV